MDYRIDEATLKELESHAAEIAEGAGKILAGHFGRSLKVDYKDDGERDPVTEADRETQSYLVDAIKGRFPDHGVLGEEDDEATRDDTSTAPDFLWVLDPLDGTRNFLHGLPVYASSIGVLFKGAPVAGAVFIPWPGAEGGGLVFHARKGGGAFVDGQRISVLDADGPKGNLLVTLPAGFGAFVGFRRPMMGKVGEMRVTGSIAYELVMVARGVSQYMVTTTPHLWDVAGGVALVMEAGGILMRGSRDADPLGLFPSTRWEEAESLVPDWRSGQTSLGDVRRWRAPLTLGSPGVARFVTANMRRRSNLRRRLVGRIRRLRPRRPKNDARG